MSSAQSLVYRLKGNGLANWVVSLARRLSHRPAPKMRYSIGETEIVLSSYPRSGNTWLRSIVADLLYPGHAQSLTSLDLLVLDVHEPIYIDQLLERKQRPVKTNYSFAMCMWKRRFHGKIIYVIRDPRLVAISYWRYLSALDGLEFPYEQFVGEWLSGRMWPCSWREHVDSWTNSNAGNSLMLLRYEDMTADLHSAIERVCRFLDIDASWEEMNRVASANSLEGMQRKENAGTRDREQAYGFQFVGGHIRVAESSVTQHSCDTVIEEACREVMGRYGYT